MLKRKQRGDQTVWVCRQHDEDSGTCKYKEISEMKFHAAYIQLHNKLLHHYRSILIPIQQMLQELKWKKYGGNIRVMDIHKEIAKLREQNHVIARLRTKSFMDEGKYQEQTKELNNKVRKLQAELKKLTRSDDEDDVLEQLDTAEYIPNRKNSRTAIRCRSSITPISSIARKNGRLQVTEQGKYSSKYALTELMICGECGTPYRRCTWNVHGKKQIVWRCISRLNHGSKYCKSSPTIHEEPLHMAVTSIWSRWLSAVPTPRLWERE